VEFFGQGSSIPVTVNAPPTNGAQFVSQSVPATMSPGHTYPVTIVMQNTGTTTWTAHGDRGLASANPLANNTWNAVRIDQPTTTAPGQTASYTFQVTAPASEGTYNFQWKMVQDQIEWFGAASPNLSIQVAAQADTVTYIHTDALGSPVARSDSAGNVIVASRTSYEPYGRTALGAIPTIGFTGHVNDADTGLVYMQQRYYDPVAGRFLSVDPVTTDANTGGSFNRYSYANNNPYLYIDPDGRFPLSPRAQITQNFQTILSVTSPGMSAAERNALTLSATNFIDENYTIFNISEVAVEFTPHPLVPGGKPVQIGFGTKDLNKLKVLQKKMARSDPKAAAALKAAIEGGIKNGTVLVDGMNLKEPEPKKPDPKKAEPEPKNTSTKEN
jgi:RHS repeat-associated protein